MADLDANTIVKTETGASPLIAALWKCHDKIRTFTALARRLADTPGLPAEDVVDAATRVRRYFVEALPRHTADEDESILPRLRGRDAALDLALRAMEAEHRLHDPLVAMVIEICEALASDPAQHAALAPRLSVLAAALDQAYQAHLRLEETVVFPALDRALDAAVQAEVQAEMAARRSRG